MITLLGRRDALARVAHTIGAAALLSTLAPAALRAEEFPLSLANTLRVGLDVDPYGEPRVYGLSRDDANEVLRRVTRADALPVGYTPTDLVSVAALGVPTASFQRVRALLAEDLQALVAAASDQGHYLAVSSAYRSFGQQQDIFAAQVSRRSGDEETANRWSARPGHSQHQLGTTIDFQSTRLFRAFSESPEGAWFWENAHHFGFVFPYTPASEPLTGYVPEPWHARWVGRGLAWWMANAAYQTAPDFTADDVVAAVRTAAALP